MTCTHCGNAQDFSTVTDAELYAELGRRRVAKRTAKAGRKPKLTPCKFCGVPLGVNAMRGHVAACRRATLIEPAA